VTELIRFEYIIPCSRSHDNVVVLNVGIVSVLDCRSNGAVTSALEVCLASISDGLIKAVPFDQSQVSTEVESNLRKRCCGKSNYAADNATRSRQQHID
jgi:hypothetical protein